MANMEIKHAAIVGSGVHSMHQKQEDGAVDSIATLMLVQHGRHAFHVIQLACYPDSISEIVDFHKEFCTAIFFLANGNCAVSYIVTNLRLPLSCRHVPAC